MNAACRPGVVTRSCIQRSNDVRRALWDARYYGAGLHRGIAAADAERASAPSYAARASESAARNFSEGDPRVSGPNGVDHEWAREALESKPF